MMYVFFSLMFCVENIFFKSLSKQGGYQMAIVGANQWKGGYIRYGRTRDVYEPTYVDPDSYLGMNMTAI